MTWLLWRVVVVIETDWMVERRKERESGDRGLGMFEKWNKGQRG